MRALSNHAGQAGTVSSIWPVRARYQEIARRWPYLIVFFQFRLAESAREQVNQGEAEDAQGGGDGEAVEEPAWVGAWVMRLEGGVLLVRSCHPSVVGATRRSILTRVQLLLHNAGEFPSLHPAALLLRHVPPQLVPKFQNFCAELKQGGFTPCPA